MTKPGKEKVSILLAVLLATALLAGCSKTSSILGGADQSDPQKFALYVAKEIFEKKNFQVLETYGSFDQKKRLKNEKASIDALKKMGWPAGLGSLEILQNNLESFENKWGKVKSFGIFEYSPDKFKASSDPRTKASVWIWALREYSKLEGHDQYMCSGKSAEECLKYRFSNIRLGLVQERDGKWYVNHYFFGRT